ncbi:MAG: DNA polymerase III subunit delta [Duncaniella sp.]|nr:DNA polymerase III subunit delta [Duncaniella sp.]
MAAPTPTLTFPQLRRSIKGGDLAPVYLLHGEEAYFTDELVKLFEESVPEEDRDYGVVTFYGAQTDADTVMDACKQFPMMTDRQVVIVKEAQTMRADQVNKLHYYVKQPVATTLLVIVFRGVEAKGKDLLAAVKKNGVIFESKKISERNLLPAIADLIKEKGMNVDPKALEMLRDFIGADLAKLYNEIDKLAMILGAGAMVTPEAVERNVGISKDYNNFELTDAIVARNAAKAFRIVDYFARNPKENPTVMTASALFNLFSNLLVYHYTRDKTQAGYMDALGFRNPWQLRPYASAAANYNVRQTIEIISAIRNFDVASKGVTSRQDPFSLLRDLVFRILTARGTIVID